MHEESIYILLMDTKNKREADQWALVLQAKGITHILQHIPEGYGIYVPSEERDKAEAEIEIYKKEQAERKKDIPLVLQKVEPLWFVLAVGALIAFHYATFAWKDRELWLTAGHSSAELILQGKWWLASTALTLHADAGHLFSNVVFGAVITYNLCRFIGSGRAWFLILVAGTAGNLFNALAYRSAHNSIGASTAVFAAVGLLSAVQFLQKYRSYKVRMWIPLAAGLGLLGSLGVGEHSDVLAHFFGFIAGLLLGVILLPFFSKNHTEGALYSYFFGIISICYIVFVWLKALL